MRVEECRGVRGDRDVGIGNEVQATTIADPIDRRDHRLPAAVLYGGDLIIRRILALDLREFLAVAARGGRDIPPGAEGLLALSRHDHASHFGVRFDLIPQAPKLLGHLVVEGVSRFGIIEGDRRNVIRKVVVHGAGHAACLLGVRVDPIHSRSTRG